MKHLLLTTIAALMLLGGVATQQQKSAELANTEFINRGPKAKEWMIPASLCPGQQENNGISY
tara:strand:+ start:713 stop:898 length:186 start_codon:yes stop_codon:yes gene_type:complete